MVSMQKIGSITVKGKMICQAAIGGTEVPAWLKIIPPYVVPKTYHISGRIMSVASIVNPNASQEYRLSGRMSSMSEDDMFSAADVPTAQDWMESQLPHEPGSQFDNTQDAQVGVGLTSSTVVGMKQSEFFDRERVLGFPKRAFYTNGDTFRYVDVFSTKGKLPRRLRGDISNPALLAFGLTTDDYQYTDDTAAVLIGSGGTGGHTATNSQYITFLRGITDWQRDSGDLEFNMGLIASATPSAILDWQHNMKNFTAVPLSASALFLDLKVTLICDVIIPDNSLKHIRAS